MKNSKLLNGLLLISGLIAIGIGGAILFVPAAFYGTYGIELGSDASLINEIRAPGGALLVTGLLILPGAFVVEFAFASTVIAAAAYLSYGLSRVVSMSIDGMPDAGLVGAAGFELVIGVAALFALLRYRRPA
jgi:hypothetical protein